MFQCRVCALRGGEDHTSCAMTSYKSITASKPAIAVYQCIYLVLFRLRDPFQRCASRSRSRRCSGRRGGGGCSRRRRLRCLHRFVSIPFRERAVRQVLQVFFRSCFVCLSQLRVPRLQTYNDTGEVKGLNRIRDVEPANVALQEVSSLTMGRRSIKYLLLRRSWLTPLHDIHPITRAPTFP